MYPNRRSRVLLFRFRKFTAVFACLAFLTAACGRVREQAVVRETPLHAELLSFQDPYEIPHGLAERHDALVAWYSVAWLNDAKKLFVFIDAGHKWWAQVQHNNSVAASVPHHAVLTYFPKPPAYSSAPVAGHTPCAIPAYICARESGYNITAQNPVSSASGKYQFLDSTWNGFGGYARAKDAPETVQDERARQVWAATGGSAWACC